MAGHSLKTKNLKYVSAVLALDFLLIWAVLSGHDMTTIADRNNPPSRLLANGLIASAVPAIALLLSYLVPAQLKANLVFWRKKNALPGCRAFSELAYKDQRIDISALRRKVGDFPSDPQDQNTLWYRLFKKHESQILVQEAHQRFLFFRDIASISLLLLSVLVLIVAFAKSFSINHVYGLTVVLTQYLLFMVAARNTGNRFVQSVLALEGSTTDISGSTEA
jgi:hypothetical protein